MSRLLTRARGRLVRLGSLAGFALAASTTPLAAQATGTIAGRVAAAEDGSPLAGVTVRVEGSTRGAITGTDGTFRLADLPPGDAVVTAQRAGRATARRTVTVVAGAVVTLEPITLAREAAILAPTVVTATREVQRRDDATAAIEVLEGEELRRTRAAHPAQLLNRLAGVHVSELSGEGHSMAIRQPITTKPMYLYLEDGIPTRATGFFNHNALYEINLPQSGGVEVIKGPGTALYGSDAIGGVVNVLTRGAPAVPSVEATLEGGADGFARLLLSGGAIRGVHGVRADLNLTRSDGWRDASSYERRSATLRWDWSGPDGLSARTVLTASDIDQNDVATIGEEAFRQRLTLNRSPIAYRAVQAVRFSSALELDRGATLWSLTPFARWNTLELIPSWQLSYDPQVWDTRSRSIGLLAKVRHELAPRRARVLAGADLDYSPGSFLAQQVVTTPVDGVWSRYELGELHYDYDVTYHAASPWLQLEVSPAERLTLEAGLRWDLVGYDYATRLAPLATGPHRRPADTTLSYSHLSPKLGLTWRALAQASLFASYRHGFRAPSQGQLFQQNSADNTVGLRPVTVDALEAGVRGEVAGRLVYQLSAYDMRIANDILTYVTPANTREATNAGRTVHRGVEASLTMALPADLRLDASWAIASHRYRTWVPQAARPATGDEPARDEVRYDGNRMEGAPRSLGHVMLAWSPPALRGGRLAAEWSRTGAYAMDPANLRTYGGHDLVHLHASGRVRPDVELFARVTNVFDVRFAETAAYDVFQGAQYQPGRGRAAYAGVRLDWSR